MLHLPSERRVNFCVPLCNLAVPLTRFKQLKELCLGLFLTTEVIDALPRCSLPSVTILGFQIPAEVSALQPQYFRSQNGGMMSYSDWSSLGAVRDVLLMPAPNVLRLASVFPSLTTFRVMYFDTYAVSNRIHHSAGLEASFMCPTIFTGLKTIVCSCRGLHLDLRNVSPLCKVVSRLADDETVAMLAFAVDFVPSHICRLSGLLPTKNFQMCNVLSLATVFPHNQTRA